jgi:hypothetical protein
MAISQGISSRTSFAAATITFIFSTASQRTVWLKPQSGATQSFSGAQ